MEKRIGFGARLGAVVIDVVLVGVLNFLIGTTIAGYLGLGVIGSVGEVGTGVSPEAAAEAAAEAASGMMSGLVAGIMAMAAISAILAVVYFLIEGFTGASPGKMILGIKVGTADGRQGNMALYLKRWGIKNSPSLLTVLSSVLAMVGVYGPGGIINIIASIGALILFIGAFWIFGASKQCLHDKLAGTAIYKRSDLTAA